jgi:hypothetical protein
MRSALLRGGARIAQQDKLLPDGKEAQAAGF